MPPLSVLDLSIPIHCLDIGYGQSSSEPPAKSGAPTPDLLIIGGGGGPGSTGLTNKLCCLDWIVSGNVLSLTQSTEFTYSAAEDAPWSVALSPDTTLLVAGVNASEHEKPNRNCRVLSRTGQFTLKEVSAFVTTSPELGTIDYQTASAFSPNGKYLATGSDIGVLSVLDTSSSEFAHLDWAPVSVGSKIYTICFTHDSSKVIVTSKAALLVYQVDSGELLLDVKPPPKHSFRAGLLGPKDSLLYTIVNQSSVKSILHVWDLSEPNRPIKSVAISNKPAVSFAIRDDIAVVGLVDCSLVVMQAFSRTIVYPNAHDVPVSALGIVQTPLGSRMIVSGSGDGMIKLWSAKSTPSRLRVLLYLPLLIIVSLVLLMTVWVAVCLYFDADQLILLEIPFWKLDHGSVVFVVDHVPWLAGPSVLNGHDGLGDQIPMVVE